MTHRMDAHVQIIVHGMVQGVGFRFFVLREARLLNINGYVKNVPTGEVIIEAEGDRGMLEDLIKKVKVGPRFADVEDLNIEWKKVQGIFKSFEVR